MTPNEKRRTNASVFFSLDEVLRKPRPLNGRCAADRDGDCTHPDCPQLRDGEPEKTGRSCPIHKDPEYS